MKNFTFITLFTLLNLTMFAQSTTGLVARWKMNGNALDATGNGHDGTMHNLVPAIGKDGNMGSALYFKGDGTTYISTPYKPDLNMPIFSICATVKVAAFYTGKCQVNDILLRGFENYVGNYSLSFGDNAYDNNCNTYDTTKYVFQSAAGTNTIASGNSWQYTPTISENTWYSVVVTFDGSKDRLYVNGVLKAILTVASGTVGVSNDSIFIGMNYLGIQSGYPYMFTGTMDDVSLYNRVLADSEAVQYTTATLAINEINVTKPAFTIFPNPAKDFLTIEMNDYYTQNATAEIYNQLGQLIKSVTIPGSYYKIPITELSNGVYFLKVKTATSSETSKFIKQ